MMKNALYDLIEPQIFKNLDLNWNAFQKWNFDFFKKHYGSMEVDVERRSTGKTTQVKLSRYIDSMASDEYLKNWQVDRLTPELRADFKKPDCFPHEKPNLLWLYIGKKNSKSSFHVDVFNTSAWLAPIQGRKKFWLSPDSSKSKIIEHVIGPGEVIYIPAGWWHEVENLDDTIALTANFHQSWSVSTEPMPSVVGVQQHKNFRTAAINGRLKKMGREKYMSKTQSAREFYFAFGNNVEIDETKKTPMKPPLYVNSVESHSVDGAWIRKLAQIQSQSLRDQLGKEVAFDPGCAKPELAKEKFESALKVLDAIWPEAAMTFKELVSHVLWVTGDAFWSSSSHEANGLIFVNPKEGWTLCHYIETIIHESAHVELSIRQLIDPMLFNSTELGASPLREDKRPLNGIFHAAFVLTRTCEGFFRMIHSINIDSATRKNAENFLSDFHQKRLDALNVLKGQARFTSAGAELWQKMDEVSKGVKWNS